MTATSATSPEVVTLEPRTTAVVQAVVPMADLRAFFDRSFGELAAALADQGVAPTGPAFALHHRRPDDTADLEVGFPTARAVEPAGEVVAGSLPGGRAARLVHQGGYDGLGEAWGRLVAWAGEQGSQPDGPFLEVYVTEPRPDVDPADLRTELYLPLDAGA